MCKGKEITVSECVIGTEVNGIPLFAGIEQDTGKNKNHSCACFKGSIAAEARQ